MITTLVLGLISYGLIRTTGYVEGEEFSPTHFRSRTFSFYEIPLIHWQITPIHRKPTTPTTAVTLTQRKLVESPPGEPSVWHLVWIRRGANDVINDDADLLMSQLRYRADGTAYWKKWTNDHPQLAKELWPTIATLSQRELYILMPRLFEMVRRVDDPLVVRSLIGGYLQTEYAGLIGDMRAAGQNALADELAFEANQDAS